MPDEELLAYRTEVSRLLAAMVDLEADRDRARDAAVALEQENAEMDAAAVRAISAEAKAVREAEAKLQAIKQLRTWKNEDGRWFVFADDLHEVMRGEVL